MKKSFLRAERPAKNWTECYPIGNGNIGVMSVGGIKKEISYLNDDRLWSGHGQKKWTDDKGKGLKIAREKLLNGDKKGAEEVLWHSVCGEFCEAYLPLGTLLLDNSFKKVKCYARTLDMNNALHIVQAVADGNAYTMEEYVSYIDGCYVKELAYDGKATTTIRYTSPLNHSVKTVDNVLVGYGTAPGRVFPNYYHNPAGNVIYDDNKGKDFGVVTAIATDGKIVTNSDSITVEEWSTLRLVTLSTVSFMEGDHIDQTVNKAQELLMQDSVTVRQRHLDDYCPEFAKVDLTVNDLEASPENTEKAIKKYHKGKGDESIVVTQFDFGRYLLLAGSRKGTQATNLQGIWNHKVQSPWSCHHTTNINLQMNYWPAEKVGLHHCILPLLEHLEKAAVIGKQVAKDTFGMNGWCMHHNTDGWYNASPVGGENTADSPMQYAYFPSGGGWLVSQLYESTLYVDDQDFVERVYQLAKGASEFYLDYLVPYDDYLVPLITTSPENAYYENGKATYVDKWTTMAVSIIKNTLTAYVALADRLGKKDNLTKSVKEAIEKLPPFAIGSDGRLLEYSEEYPEVEKKHRHVSHLYPVFPGDQITWNGTPDLMVSAKNVLNTRGLLGTGWSLSWKLNLCARFKDKKAVATLLKNFNNLIKEEQIIYRGGGCYPSCLCAHPPFQIDGNYGFTSGVCEMLVQSHDGKIELAPCLPDSWKKVVVKGLKARGGKTINYTYDNGVIKEEA